MTQNDWDKPKPAPPSPREPKPRTICGRSRRTVTPNTDLPQIAEAIEQYRAQRARAQQRLDTLKKEYIEKGDDE
jgi:hypothetical protein